MIYNIINNCGYKIRKERNMDVYTLIKGILENIQCSYIDEKGVRCRHVSITDGGYCVKHQEQWERVKEAMNEYDN